MANQMNDSLKGIERTATELQEIQQSLDEGKGNEINRNFWNSILAENFPRIGEAENGEVTTLSFLGQMYRKVGSLQ